jgi:hypothetical protein
MSQPAKARHHLAQVVRFSPAEISKAMAEVEGFNAKLAVLITSGVGTMACAYVFCLIALLSLPAILIQAGCSRTATSRRSLQSPG